MKSNSQGIRLGHNFNDRDNQNKILSEELETTLFDQKIELATEGLEPYYRNHLNKM